MIEAKLDTTNGQGFMRFDFEPYLLSCGDEKLDYLRRYIYDEKRRGWTDFWIDVYEVNSMLPALSALDPDVKKWVDYNVGRKNDMQIMLGPEIIDWFYTKLSTDAVDHLLGEK